MKRRYPVCFLISAVLLVLFSSLLVLAQSVCDENDECLMGICSSIISEIRNFLTDNAAYPTKSQKISGITVSLRNYFLARESGVEESCAPVSPGEGYCCLDNSLKVGSSSFSPCEGDTSNVESIPSDSIDDCRRMATTRGYRYSTYYFTTHDFAVVCTEPCSINDDAFFQASFAGHILGVDALKEAVGYLPKKKMEFHLGRDGDCFTEGYGEHPTGYAGTRDGHPQLCNSGYWWYLELQGTTEERDLDYYRSIESQTLTIHEPIHRIFVDYSSEGFYSPEYKIQESFAKGVSLHNTGTFPGYDHEFYTGYGVYSLENPPPEGDPVIYNFLIYSLNQRYGFDEMDLKEFFRRYRELENINTNGNLKVKQIIDEVLGTDTSASFGDVGIFGLLSAPAENVPIGPEYPLSDELDLIPLTIITRNIKVIVPRIYEAYGEKLSEDIEYCFDLVPEWIGISSFWNGIIAKAYVSNDGQNLGYYNRKHGMIAYKRSQENFDLDLSQVVTNSPDGFFYQSSPTYCSNTHEFTHYVVTHTPLPSWADEGIAEYSQKFNQLGSKEDTECSQDGFYSGDPWETGAIRRFFGYSDLSEGFSQELGAGPKWYRSAMCFWELFDAQFGAEARRSAFQRLRNDFTGNFNYDANGFRIGALTLNNGREIPDQQYTSVFIEEVLFEVVDEEELKPLLSRFGLEESVDFNLN